MNETVWKNKEKKWSPRNKQAAFIIRKANPSLLHVAPHEPTKTERIPTLQERLAAESKIRLARIASIEKENRERLERRAAERIKKQKPKKPKVWKNMWAVKNAKRMAKSRGLPPPTIDELRQLRASLPNYGKPL